MCCSTRIGGTGLRSRDGVVRGVGALRRSGVRVHGDADVEVVCLGALEDDLVLDSVLDVVG